MSEVGFEAKQSLPIVYEGAQRTRSFSSDVPLQDRQLEDQRLTRRVMMECALNTLVEVQHQMARFMEQDHTGLTGASSKFHVMEATEDIEDYLLLFEHHMMFNKIPEEEWT